MSDAPSAAASAGLRLTCKPSKAGNVLLFPYTLENQGPGEVFVMHALPSADPASGEARPNAITAVVIAGDGNMAIIGKFAAPLPTDRYVALPVFPLARRLPARASLDGQVEIPLPLAETSPYFPDLPLRRYEIVEIQGIIFTIGYWFAGADGLSAVPATYAPDLFEIETRHTLRSAHRVSQHFPTSGLQLFKRTDAFPRFIA
jgi:hypothetical protein